MEEIRLQELKNARELVAQKEENQYLKNLVAEQEKSISSLEQDIVQQNMVRIQRQDVFPTFSSKAWRFVMSQWVLTLTYQGSE